MISPQQSNIKIKTITPIWTGDIDSKSDSIISTGFAGSLRWWTEAILRGMDNFVCDPTERGMDNFVCDPTEDNTRCPKKDKDEKFAYYCPACLIFGATGIRRTFKLSITGGKPLFNDKPINIRPSNRNRGWYLGSGVKGQLELEITPLAKEFKESIIYLPLIIASKWGGIGARTQHGYGVVEVQDLMFDDYKKYEQDLENIINNKRLDTLKIKMRKEKNNLLPDIRDMFFAKVQFEVQDDDWWKEVDGIRQALNPIDRRKKLDKIKQIQNTRILTEWFNSGSIPIAPAIKNWLRFGKEIKLKNGKDFQVSPFNEIHNIEISQWLFGSSDENNKIASKINLSCAYRINSNLWEFRMWGWIPESSPSNGFDREGFLDSLKKSLNGNGSANILWNDLLGSKTKDHKLKIWREFKSNRDTVKQMENKIENYLQSLINSQETFK